MAVATDGLNLLQPVIQFPGPGSLSHRVVSRVPLHIAGYHSVEGYPCAHLEPGRQLVRPGAIAQPSECQAVTWAADRARRRPSDATRLVAIDWANSEIAEARQERGPA